jgi:hypothetical protein
LTLDPFFFQAPPDFADQPSDPEFYFRVLGYSREQNYTLVSWGYGDNQEIIAGQNLYRDRELLATSGGALLSRENRSRGKAGEPDYQQLMQQSIQGSNTYGVPQHIVDRLLDLANYHNFTGGTA